MLGSIYMFRVETLKGSQQKLFVYSQSLDEAWTKADVHLNKGQYTLATNTVDTFDLENVAPHTGYGRGLHQILVPSDLVELERDLNEELKSLPPQQSPRKPGQRLRELREKLSYLIAAGRLETGSDAHSRTSEAGISR